MTNNNAKRKEGQRGYAMVLALAVSAVASVIMYRELQTSATATMVVMASKERTRDFYAAETAFNQAVTWLRQNSTGMARQFSRDNFYTNFDKSTAPSIANNDLATVKAPSKVRSNGTNNAVLLTNSASFGTSLFPAGVDTTNGNPFDAVSTFATANFGSQRVRIALIDSYPNDASKDFGDLPNPAPQTDFNPSYRIDVMNSENEGAHLFGYLSGTLVFEYGIGFYGRDHVEFRQNCDSYLSNNGPYNASTRRANCAVGSGGPSMVLGSSTVYGTLRTTGSIVQTAPYGGNICSDFIAGCPNKGQTCEGASCTVPGLPSYSTWATYCPTDQGTLTVNSNQTLTIAGTAANQKCWNTVRVNSNRVLTLTSTNVPYFIDTFDIANNSVVAFNPSPGNGIINLYVRKFVGDRFNGNQVFNSNNKPYQLRIHYLGTDPLTLNGTAQINAFLVAPYAPVTVSGNFTYQGGIKTTQLIATGSGAMRYDESGDITTISDVTYRVRNIEQYQR